MATEIKSSNIKSVSYNSEEQVLVVEYLSGAMYEYMSVPAKVYEDLLAAESKGSYMNRFVKNNFSYIRIQ